MKNSYKSIVTIVALSFIVGSGCKDDEPEYAGMPCTAPEDCYPGVEDPGALPGEIDCITRVSGGYCTHTCVDDGECCSVPGECVGSMPQVCAPFESLPDMRCFLSCESDEIGDWDDTEYCATYAHPSFICRSSGGGSANRKICVPPGS